MTASPAAIEHPLQPLEADSLSTVREEHDSGATTPKRVTAGQVGSLLLVALALLSMVAPFATDLYLPAFPEMTSDLRTDPIGVQLTLTTFLLGIAVGQLCFGPLSDRFGRKTPLLIGALLCLMASAVAALAPSIVVLVIARLVQGFTGAAGVVIGRAIIADIATGIAAARAFNLLMIVGGIAPVVAPLLGGFLADPIGWRGIMWVVVALVALMVVAIVFIVRETHTRDRRARLRAAHHADGSAVRALSSPVYLGYTFAVALSFAVLMAYVSASPFLYQTMMGLDALQYGLLFGANAVGLTVVSLLSSRLAPYFSLRRLLGTGLAVAVTASLVLLLLALLEAPTVWMAVAVFVGISSLGLVLGNGTSLALEQVPGAVGTGSAVLGALQFGLGALASPLVGLGGEHTAVPLATVMAVAAVAAALAFWWARARRSQPLT